MSDHMSVGEASLVEVTFVVANGTTFSTVTTAGVYQDPPRFESEVVDAFVAEVAGVSPTKEGFTSLKQEVASTVEEIRLTTMDQIFLFKRDNGVLVLTQ